MLAEMHVDTMFTGTYTHSLDPAGRFIMPHIFRTSLGSNFFITKGINCLCVLTEHYADTMREQLQSIGTPLQIMLDPDMTRLYRHFFGEMIKTKSDSQNRVAITPEHRKYAGIQDEVAICGCGQYLEIWQPEALSIYRNEQESADKLIIAGSAVLQWPKGEEDA